MANIKISQLVLATPGPESIFPFTDNGATYKGFVSGLTTNYIEVTKNELVSLVITSSLIPGYFYIIEGVDVDLYGGTTIILEAVSNNKLSDYGSGIFYNPKYDQSIDGYGIWTRLMTPVFNSISGGSFQYGETVVSDSGDTATFIGDELLEWVNGQWSGSLLITGLTSGVEASIESYSRPNYVLNDRVIWGGKHWLNLGGIITNEVISTGDGTSSYSGYTNVSPIGPLTFSITTSVEDFADDGSGNLTGTGGGTGTVDYDLGLWSITAFTSVGSGSSITSSYIATPVGNYVDKYTLNSIWFEIDYDSINYNIVIDEIRYDYTNDKITYRKDSFGNEVSCNYQVISQFEIDTPNGLGNPIKDFQWGNNQTNWGVTPGLYLFNDVPSTSDNIDDGGNNLFDVGNTLNSENFTQIPYTHTQMTNPPINLLNPAGEVNYSMDGVVLSGDSYFGVSSEYFTNLYPGLFVMVAYGTNVDNFYIDGSVGADCNGDLDDYQNTYTGYSTTYTAYIKRYFNNTDLEPSNNHIIIVDSDGTGITHDFTSGGCDSDYDSLSGLTGSNVNKVYYLLMSQFPNEKISDEQIDEVVNVFLTLVDNQTIGDSLTALNNNYVNITSLFPNYETLDKFGIMNNKVVDSYMDCLNFVGGHIWNNNLVQNSIFANNTFSPIREPYFSDNNLSINSVFDDNIFSSNSFVTRNTFINSEIGVNNFVGYDGGYSQLSSNLFEYSIMTGNGLHNSSIVSNEIKLSSSLNSNSLIDSDLEFNTVSNESTLNQNILINSFISNNKLSQNSSVNLNDLADSTIQHNNIEHSSNISSNFFVDNGSIEFNLVSYESSLNNNSLISNSFIQNNDVTQNSQILLNSGYTNSYIQTNKLFYSFVSGNNLNDSCFIQENILTNYSEITSNNLINSSFISNNEINNESYILDNQILLGSEFIQNYLNSSYIYDNVSSASTISRNSCNVLSEIYLNNLTSSNIWKNKIDIESSVYNGNFVSSSFSYNSLKNTTIDLLSSCLIDTKVITKTNFSDSVVDDISENSTVIYDTYSKNVFTNSTGVTRISYYNASDSLIIGDINDSILPTLYISAWTATSLYDIDVTVDITLDGGNSVTERGVVWSLSGYPTVSDNIVVDGGTGTGVYTDSLTGLTSGSTIYFRGYAVNSSGTGYTCQDTYLTT